MTRILALILALSFTTAAHAAPIDNSDGFWSEWSDATFARAAREKKFVIMSLQSWWCRWCHVMNQETWSNAEVRGILKDKFIPVYVDQDSRPDISQRYERWGWPAGMVGQARRQARQYRRRLSGFPRRTRGVRLRRSAPIR
jgi:thioredoxin-related protein